MRLIDCILLSFTLFALPLTSLAETNALAEFARTTEVQHLMTEMKSLTENPNAPNEKARVKDFQRRFKKLNISIDLVGDLNARTPIQRAEFFLAMKNLLIDSRRNQGWTHGLLMVSNESAKDLKSDLKVYQGLIDELSTEAKRLKPEARKLAEAKTLSATKRNLKVGLVAGAIAAAAAVYSRGEKSATSFHSGELSDSTASQPSKQETQTGDDFGALPTALAK
jgi:hypothetical protein